MRYKNLESIVYCCLRTLTKFLQKNMVRCYFENLSTCPFILFNRLGMILVILHFATRQSLLFMIMNISNSRIVLKLLEPKQSYWNPKSFGNMHHLKLLKIDKIHLLHDPQTYSKYRKISQLEWILFKIFSIKFPTKVV